MKMLDLLKLKGAVMPGHFVLKSGAHSDMFFNVPNLARRPIEGRQISDGLAAQFAEYDIDTVVGVATGGIKFATWVAERLEGIHSSRWQAGMPTKIVHCIDTYKCSTGRLRINPIDAESIAQKKCIVIDDLATTGGTIREVEGEILRYGGMVVGAGAIVRRGNHDLTCFEVFKSVCTADTNEYSEEECPLCQEGVPINTTYGHGGTYLERKSSAL